MGKKLNPRHGSMQFWPRVRAKRQYARIRSLPNSSEAKLLAFAGYKVGMTHVMALDSGKNSMTKGEQVAVPVTVIECPAVKIASVRFYEPHGYGTRVATELFFKTDKEFIRKTFNAKTISSADDLAKVDLTNVTDVTAVIYTQPKLSGLDKKKPEIMEIGLGGSNEEKVAYLKDKIGNEITVSEIISQGSFVDARAVTTGKGYQGPVKRFGVSLRAKKSEKTKRGPGSLGGWVAQGHIMYRVAFAGQMGYQQRTQYSNLIMAVEDDVTKVNPEGGFINYGEAKSTCILVKGSVPGPKKRLITLTAPLRKAKATEKFSVELISKASQQGN
jgi:large subunit ribosomal protein L3